jgi:uncharacterized membrane protein YbaN (DUF454 family)
LKKFVLEALGWALLATGIAGLLLPFLPGIPLAIAGLVILSREYAWAAKLIEALGKRFPRLARKSEVIWRSTRVRWGSGD